MVKVIVLLTVEVALIVLVRSLLWKRLIRLASEGRLSVERGKPVAASLIRTAGHLWLLLGFVPAIVFAVILLSVEDLEAPAADLLAVSALGLIAWCGWNAVRYYRWALRIRGL